MKKKLKITLIIPILNELDSLTVIIPKIKKSLFDEILIVDGHSTDGSVSFLKKNGFNNIIYQTKPGLENAILEAVNLSRNDYVIEFSPDGNCKPDDLEKLVIEINKGYDVVVISRYLDNAKSYDDTIVTAFGNYIFSLMFNFLGPNRITDSLTIFRCFRKSAFNWNEISLYNKGPVFEPLITGLAQVNKLKLSEIPGDEPKRIGGESKMKIFYNGFSILYMWARLFLKKITTYDFK